MNFALLCFALRKSSLKRFGYTSNRLADARFIATCTCRLAAADDQTCLFFFLVFSILELPLVIDRRVASVTRERCLREKNNCRLV